ncbi:biotin-dependent carboxyltransferase family protein [Gymnodinialimonas sp. 57CJ19]|uniref:5-oxoprolinase subunit C family protein n=1 Tax=Gymnodinialimonas sp. 57CJ19 TaxID=3138498 RepID=UPI003134394F
MSVARLKVSFAGPLVSFQDAGRAGVMRFGVPASGPMDRFSFAAAHAMLGQPTGTAIEVSLGGLVLECTEGAVTCAVAGGAFDIARTGPGWQVLTLQEGDTLTIRGGAWGSWCYLAFAGNIVADEWLGSSATHTLSGLGGGTVRMGDSFTVRDTALRPSKEGPYDCPEIAHPQSEPRVVIGPQDHHFAPGAVRALTTTRYQMTDAFDRMGVRLNGAALPLGNALSIPSEPILRGAIQVAGDGVPVVLLADHQTTGGYPKIATVLSADTDRLAQNRAGDALRFVSVTADDAILLARETHRARLAALETLAAPRASLQQRLMQANLISGVTDA